MLLPSFFFQGAKAMRKSETALLPTMKPFEPRRSLHSLLRVQTRWLTTLKHKTYTSTPLVLLRYLRMPTTKLTSAAFSPGEKGIPGFRNCHRNYAPSYSLLRYRLRQVWHPKKARLRCIIRDPPRIEACHLGESIDYPQLSWPDWVFGSPTTKSIEMPSQDLFGTGMDTLLLPLFSSWQIRNAP